MLKSFDFVLEDIDLIVPPLASIARQKSRHVEWHVETPESLTGVVDSKTDF